MDTEIRPYFLQRYKEPTTNNAVQAWNSTWNKSVGTNHNVLRVINNFKPEDSMARTKFLQVEAGTYTDR